MVHCLVMANDIITYTISNDPSTLGPDAGQEDIEAYASGLEEAFAREFPGLTVRVVVGSVMRSMVTGAQNEDASALLEWEMRNFA